MRRLARTIAYVMGIGGLVLSALALSSGVAAAGGLPGPGGHPGGPGGPPGYPTRTVFASPTGTPSCGWPAYPTISAAVGAAPAGGTVVVCPGTYTEDVLVQQPVTIIGHGATVDPGTATNSPFASLIGNNAFTVTAPNVTIEGFTVEGANGDGILSAGNNSNFRNNLAENNAGTGIDLNGSSWSTVAGNTALNNGGGGYYLTNDAGGLPQFPGATASHDTVVGNVAKGNPGGCGVILADHLGATTGVNTAQGIFDNTVANNVLEGNGTVAATPGAGVVLASPAPGGAVYDNTVIGNTISGNGLGGVTLHSHIAGQYFAGNRIIGNNIGTNNLLGDYGDTATTGVYLGSVSPLSVVVTGNAIHGNQYGIFAAGPVTVVGKFSNCFNVAVPFGSTPVYAG
jgi:parallel beta-helix repeat protein